MKLLACAALCLVADAAVAWADYLGKKWVLGAGGWYLAAAFALCNVSVASWFAFFKLYGDLGRAAAIWNSVGVLAAVLIGVFVFGEHLTWVSRTGVILAVAGVVCLGVQK